jgi:hypothetical protein
MGVGSETPSLRAEATRTRAAGFLPLLVVWSSWLVLKAGANLATPLYAVYAREFGFSSLVLTSVVATYAFVLVPSLASSAASPTASAAGR